MNHLIRKNDWDIQLFNIIQENQNTLFKWGEHDCALFAANAILVMTGEDLAKEVRGTYKTFKGSLKAIKTLGKIDLTDMAKTKLGEPKHALMASRGDVVLVKTATTPALGIVTGSVAVVPGPEGLTHVKMDDWLMAWTV